MLEAKGYTDNCHAQHQPEYQMDDAKLNAANQNPDDIAESAHYAKASGPDVAPKWPKCKTRDLKALHAKRYANYYHAQQKAENRP